MTQASHKAHEKSIVSEDDRFKPYTWTEVISEAIQIGYEPGADINRLCLSWENEYSIMDLATTGHKRAAA